MTDKRPIQRYREFLRSPYKEDLLGILNAEFGEDKGRIALAYLAAAAEARNEHYQLTKWVLLFLGAVFGAGGVLVVGIVVRVFS